MAGVGGDAVRIPGGLLPLYAARFVGPCASPPYGRRDSEDEPWRTCKRPRRLYDGLIAGHLRRDYALAVLPDRHTSTLLIDLDAHTPDQEQTLDQRTERALSIFPGSLLFSTPRGRNLVQLLDSVYPSPQVTAFATDQLRSAGIDLTPGDFEVRPNGAQMSRLPGGPGSYMLDPATFMPMALRLEDALDVLIDVLANERFDTLKIPKDYPVAQRRRSVGRVCRRPDPEYDARLAQWQSAGLTGPRQRNQFAMDMARDLVIFQGLESAEATARLCAALDRGHNGHSREYDRDPQGAYDKCRDAIAHYVRVRAATAPAKGPGGEEAVEPHLLAFVDSRGVSGRQARLYAAILARAHRQGKRTADGTALDVEIPHENMARWGGRSYRAYKRGLLKRGLLEVVREYSKQRHECYLFRVPSVAPVPVKPLEQKSLHAPHKVRGHSPPDLSLASKGGGWRGEGTSPLPEPVERGTAKRTKAGPRGVRGFSPGVCRPRTGVDLDEWKRAQDEWVTRVLCDEGWSGEGALPASGA